MTSRIDADAFVAQAERVTNDRSTIRTIYSPRATSLTIMDGLVAHDVGIDAIERRWRVMCRFMSSRDLVVRKCLLSASDDTIVNDWTGTMRGGARPAGLEFWRLDPDGLVIEQRLIGSLNPRADTSATGRLAFAAAHPVSAASFLRAERARR